MNIVQTYSSLSQNPPWPFPFAHFILCSSVPSPLRIWTNTKPNANDQFVSFHFITFLWMTAREMGFSTIPPFPLTHSVPSLGDAAAVAAAKNARWPFLILMAHCYPFNRIFQLWLLQFHVWHFAYMQNVSAHEMLMEHEYAWIYVNCELMCVCVHFMQLWWTRNGQHQIRSKRKQRKTDNGTKKLVCVCVCVCVSVSLATKIQRQ